MASNGIVYTPSFIMIGSELSRGDTHTDTQTYRQTHTQQGGLICLFLFLKNKKNRLKIIINVFPERLWTKEIYARMLHIICTCG
jgi:hypothetical protein